MGLRTVTELTVVACLKPAPKEPSIAKALSRVWTHAVATAGFARHISRIRRRQVESSFLCGLLHSIGALVLLDRGESSEEAIAQRYVEVGVKVAMHWLMPASVVAAVGLHRDWHGAQEYADEAATTWLARLLAQELLERPLESAALDEDPVLDRLDIYPNDLERLRGSGEDVLALVTVLA